MNKIDDVDNLLVGRVGIMCFYFFIIGNVGFVIELICNILFIKFNLKF